MIFDQYHWQASCYLWLDNIRDYQMSVSGDIEPDVVDFAKRDSDALSHQSWTSDSELDSSYHSSSPSEFDSSSCPIEHSDTEESCGESEKPNESFGLPAPVRTI